MITELTKAVIAKHGPLVLKVDTSGRLMLSRLNDPNKLTHYAFSIGSVLIRMLAEDKL